MEIAISVEYGSLQARFTGEDREELQNEVLEFYQFIETNSEEILSIQKVNPKGGSEIQTEIEETVDEEESHPLLTIAREIDVSFEALNKAVYVDPSLEEHPQIAIDPDTIGNTTVEQQRNAAYVLLYIWDECYGNGRMKTTDLKDFLSVKGISTAKLSRAWKGDGEGDFDPRGRGQGATVGLTGLGKRSARKVLQDLANKAN